MQHISETYLGDGLYASYDGYQIQLRAPREDGDACTYLTDEVYASLLCFVKTIECSE